MHTFPQRRYRYSCALLLFVAVSAYAAGPHVTKVEPPNWWLGLPSPMLLLTGDNLAGAHVSSSTTGVRVVRTEDGLEGKYLLVWLDTSQAAAEPVKLSVSTSDGQQDVLFPLERPSGAGFSGFGPNDVIYLIMPDRFADGDIANNFPDSGSYDRKAARAYHGGDLRGIEQHLPYLKDLGVTTIWTTPIYQNDDRTGRDYHGYGATDMYAVEKHLGTLADYKSLVAATHAMGMKVILDMVPNHVGPTNPWVDHPPTQHWFHGTRDKHLATHSPFDGLTDPHAPERAWRDVVEGWFGNILPDMGTDDAVTSQYLRQNALWWTETAGLDGARLDTFPYVDRKFWHDFHAELHTTWPGFRTVGEVFNSDPSITSYFAGGVVRDGIDTGVDSVFDFPLYTAIRKIVLEDRPATQFEEVLRHDWMYPHPDNLVTFLGNHDTTRFMNAPGATPQKAKLAFSLLVTMRGIPQLYYGDEIGMTGGDDPENRHDFPGGFPGDTRNAFTSQGRTPQEQDIFSAVQTLLHLRREHPALREGMLTYLFADDKTYAYLRAYRSVDGAMAERLLMVMNNADQPRTARIELQDTPAAGAREITPLLGQGATEIQGTAVKLEIPGRTLNIYTVK